MAASKRASSAGDTRNGGLRGRRLLVRARQHAARHLRQDQSGPTGEHGFVDVGRRHRHGNRDPEIDAGDRTQDRRLGRHPRRGGRRPRESIHAIRGHQHVVELTAVDPT